MQTQQKLDLKRLKPFGSTAYVKIFGPLRKLDIRNAKCQLIGYALNGYRLWDKSRRKIVIARNVVIE